MDAKITYITQHCTSYFKYGYAFYEDMRTISPIGILHIIIIIIIIIIGHIAILQHDVKYDCKEHATQQKQ